MNAAAGDSRNGQPIAEDSRAVHQRALAPIALRHHGESSVAGLDASETPHEAAHREHVPRFAHRTRPTTLRNSTFQTGESARRYRNAGALVAGATGGGPFSATSLIG